METRISIVIATYSGEEHINNCLKSILRQSLITAIDEVIVIVDGPRLGIVKKIETLTYLFKNNNINLVSFMFTKNRGRFIARQYGAKKAKSEQLLFVDDRVTLDNEFIEKAQAAKARIIIANAIEAGSPKGVNLILKLIRGKLYKVNDQGEFSSYYITKDNFESSPKGTAGFWIDKSTFLEACKVMAKDNFNQKFINEDTRLFRTILDLDINILKSSEVVIRYYPRRKLSDQLIHLYERGPRMVNYYMKRGTRFSIHLYVFITIVILISLTALFNFHLILYYLYLYLISLLILSVYIASNFREFLSVVIFLPAVTLAVSLGVLKGFLIIPFTNIQNKT